MCLYGGDATPMATNDQTGDATNDEVIAAWSAAAAAHADDFDDEGDFTRRHMLNPAIFELLGDVAGRRILDAGCGQGYLCRLLARRGAHVTGAEPAAGWIAQAVAREATAPLGITYIQADLSTFADDSGGFDAVVANMVFMDIPDYVAAMRACIAALRPGGRFVFSLLHPCFEESGSAWASQGYVAVREYLSEYTTPQTSFGVFFHRPLSAYITLLLAEGCALRAMREPQLDPQLAREYGAERYTHVPGYVVIGAERITVDLPGNPLGMGERDDTE